MRASRIKSMPWRVFVQFNAVLPLLLALAVPGFAQEDSATKQPTGMVNESAQAVAEGITTLQTRFVESSPVNRTLDENVALVLMGVLVASFAGMFSKIRSSGAGIAGRLLLGLGGAFIGSMLVRIAQIDFGWGEVIMNYEEMLFSLVGAVAIVVLSRFIQYQMKHKKAKS